MTETPKLAQAPHLPEASRAAVIARDLAIIGLLALAFNLSFAAAIREPNYVDDAYYFGGALRLVQDNGFTEPYLWNHLGEPATLPQPSHLYWMPLTSIVAAGAMALLGQTFVAARLPFVLLASLLPLVSYGVARQATGVRRHAVGAGLLTVFCGYYTAYWGTTDSFALFGVFGSLTLLIAASDPREQKPWRPLAVGLAAGLAHLARADGALLLAVAGWQAVTGRRPWGAGGLALMGLGYLLVMGPWLMRNALVAGNPLGAGSGALWLTEYNDLFNFPSDLSPARYMASGVAAILRGKWEAAVLNLQHIVAEQGLVFFWPFIAIGLWRQRQAYRHVLVYAGLLYFAMTFVFTFVGLRGGLFHSGVALLPFYFSAGLSGLDAAVDGAAARLKHWQPEHAKANFTGLVVATAAVLTLVVGVPKAAGWGGAGAAWREVLAGLPPGVVVMSNNPPGVWVATGHPGIPWVNGDEQALLEAADHYGAAYALLDPNVPAGLRATYEANGGPRLELVRTLGAWKLFAVTP